MGPTGGDLLRYLKQFAIMAIKRVFWFVLLSFCSYYLAWTLDSATGGSELDFNTKLIRARVQNTTAIPLLCRDIIRLDAVANISVAETCSEWCHEALGPNGAVPYMLSWVHVAQIVHTEQYDIYMTCWKSQIAAWSLELMPEWYWVYLVAMVYGMWSTIAFLWTFFNTEPQTVPGGPAEDHVTSNGPYGRRCGDIPCCCLPVRSNEELPTENGWNEAPLCYPVSSDRNGSEIGLKIAAFFICFEPFGDIVSVLTLLRIGQPFPAEFMAFGIALACAVSRDPLQLAESLRKGFETRALMEHKDHELWESLFCATVQVYSLMSLHPKTAKFSTGLNLLVSASVNLAISIPGQIQASHVIRELEGTDWTFAAIQEAKRSPLLRLQKVLTTLTIVFTATLFGMYQHSGCYGCDDRDEHLIHLESWLLGSEDLWSILFDPETWQQWLLALVVICIRWFGVSLVLNVVYPFEYPFLLVIVLVSVICWVLMKCCFPSDGRSNSQTDDLPLLDTESALMSARLSLKCEDSQPSEMSSEA